MKHPQTFLALLMALTIAACTSNPDKSRSAGTLIDDNVLEVVIAREIRNSDPLFKSAHIVVNVFDGLVLLTGEVPSQEMLTKATSVAEGLYKVERGMVHNHMAVSGPISLVARTNDAILAAKVKSRLLATKGVPGRKIKVATENGIVYLLGKITREEAELAVLSTQKSFGVIKIVKIFDYVDEPAAVE